MSSTAGYMVYKMNDINDLFHLFQIVKKHGNGRFVDYEQLRDLYEHPDVISKFESISSELAEAKIEIEQLRHQLQLRDEQCQQKTCIPENSSLLESAPLYKHEPKLEPASQFDETTNNIQEADQTQPAVFDTHSLSNELLSESSEHITSVGSTTPIKPEKDHDMSTMQLSPIDDMIDGSKASRDENDITMDNLSSILAQIKIFVSLNNTGISMNLDVMKLANDEYIEVSNQFSTVRSKYGQLPMYVYWPPSSLVLSIRTNSNTSSYISIIAQQAPTFSDTPIIKRTVPGVEPFIIDSYSMVQGSVNVFTSETHVVLSSLTRNSDVYTSGFLNYWVYDGVGLNSTLIGTVYNTLNNQPFISTGKSLTIAAALSTYTGERIIVNDYENVNSLGEMKMLWSYNASNSQVLTLNATTGPATLTMGCFNGPYNSVYLTAIQFSDRSASLIAYTGGPIANASTSVYNVAQYDATSGYRLPQQFPGYIRTFQLDKGIATIKTTISPEESKWSIAREGRLGFISTSDYPFISNSQNINNLFIQAASSKTPLYTFIFRNPVSSQDVNATYTLKVRNKLDQIEVHSGYMVDLRNVTEFKAVGKSVNLTVYGGTTNSSGAYMTFEIAKHSSKAAGLLASILVIFLLC